MLTKGLFSFLFSIPVLSSVILGLVALLAVLTMFHLLYGGDLMDDDAELGDLPKNKIFASVKKFFKRCYLFNGKATSKEWTFAVIAGFAVGMINYFALQIHANTFWLAWVFLAAVFAGYVTLTVLWVKGGTEVAEAAWFSVAALAMWFPAKTLLIMVTPIEALWLLPTLVVIALIAYFFTDAISRRTGSNGLAWTLRVIAIILIALLLVTTLTGCGDSNNGNQPPSGGTAQPTTTWYRFYNLDLQKDKDTSNDFDFGPNPANKSWTAADYDREFRNRLKYDPALGAGDMAWLDANVGTRYLGKFYESCKGDWAKTINAAAADWIEDPDGQVAYYRNLDAFFAFLDTGKVTIAEGGKDIEDQMYMNPYTYAASHAPDVIVMKTDQKDGLFLIYTFTIKGNEFQVKYRINCGYQPTNVEEVMGITPQDKPSGGDTPTPTNPGDNPSPGPSPSPTNSPSPSPTNPPTPTYNKDPNKAPSENTEENDDKGPGPDTNNGVGATTSTQDNPNNSAYYDSYDDYRRDMDEMENINQNQRTGNDGNTPSSGGGSSTNVDSNADNGTGYGGINTATPVQDSAQTSDGHNVTDDNPGEAWGGSPD